MSTIKFTGSYLRNDFKTLLNGFLTTRALKSGLLKRKSQVYGAPEKVHALSILLMCNANVRLRIAYV